MNNIRLKEGRLTPGEQCAISAGFDRHSSQFDVPDYESKRCNWLVYGDDNAIIGALTADVLWNWIYIDELWVDESLRGQGYGKKLMDEVERFANEEHLYGLWLWTQSWQAADFYQHLGYKEFVRFPEFPEGHSRFGFRKIIKNLDSNR